MDHDRLFKQLLHEFFTDFLDLFLPEVAGYIEPGSVEFLDKEVFTDLTAGDRHEVDLLVKCRAHGPLAEIIGEAYFLIHIETQASARENFARRMFTYCARLMEKLGLPVYPIALFTYDAPARPESDRFEVAFPDLKVLQFQFRVIQLNRLNWRDFVRRPNPVAAALMAKMRLAPGDRPRVQLECLRLIATLKLNPARQALIREFMTSYLRLSAAERAVYDSELKTLDPPEREAVMQIIDQWEESGLRKGQVAMIVRFLSNRFGELPVPLRERIEALPETVLESLADAFGTLASPADLEAWLSTHA